VTHKVKVTLLRGPDFYWEKACEFTRKKQGFTTAELAGCTCGVANSTIQQWVKAMNRQGELKVVGSRPTRPGCKAAHVYAVARIRTERPVVRVRESVSRRGRVQQQLWTAMRTLHNFSSQELAVAASIEECIVSRVATVNYIRFLSRVGMLIAIEEPATKKGHQGMIAGRWRLARVHNTGPLPPQIFQARFVFDPNRDQIVGESEVLS
jgi:hypothetical protein